MADCLVCHAICLFISFLKFLVFVMHVFILAYILIKNALWACHGPSFVCLSVFPHVCYIHPLNRSEPNLKVCFPIIVDPTVLVPS